MSEGIEPRTYWDEDQQMFVVPEGACPYPIYGNWTVVACNAAGNCGCDAKTPASTDRGE